MKKTLGIVAEFTSPAALLHAAEILRDNRYSKFDCHSPFPIHGMDQAMGLKRSILGYIVGIFAFLGAALGFGLQSWSHAVAYPLVISGKPYFAWQAYVVITFALLVLFGAISAVFGMLSLNRLPHYHHPVFYSDHFENKASDDGFFVSIDATDDQFEINQTKELLVSMGSTHIELLEDEG